VTRLLRLGALAGLAGGIALALFLRLVGEGPIGDAVRLEAQRASGGSAHDELFSRATQQVGGMIGAALFGVCAGAVLAVVLAAVRHRLAATDDWRRAVTVAAVAFVTVGLVPELKYPANPPAVGNPDTIGRRTALYLVMLAWSLVSAWAAWRLSCWLRERSRPDHVRLPAVAGLYAALVGLGLAVLPGSPDAVDAPATLVWRFRLAAVGGSLLFWAVTGVALGWLLLRGRAVPAGAPAEPAPVDPARL
jgi:predicted cobalt transporter CbtA